MGIGSDRREEGGGRGKKRREEMRGNERREERERKREWKIYWARKSGWIMERHNEQVKFHLLNMGGQIKILKVRLTQDSDL